MAHQNIKIPRARHFDLEPGRRSAFRSPFRLFLHGLSGIDELDIHHEFQFSKKPERLCCDTRCGCPAAFWLLDYRNGQQAFAAHSTASHVEHVRKRNERRRPNPGANIQKRERARGLETRPFRKIRAPENLSDVSMVRPTRPDFVFM